MRKNPGAPVEYDLDRLFSYALWYTGKYRVSRAKLLEKLHSKSGKPADIESVMAQLDPYHSDALEIRSHIESCLARSKPIRYVKNSLQQKKFKKEDVESIMQEYEAFQDYDSFSIAIEKRVASLMEKGSGPRGIQADLTQKYPQFAKRIAERCKEIDENELLDQLYRQECPGAKPTPKETKKIQDTLLRKGFSYTGVSRYVRRLGGAEYDD